MIEYNIMRKGPKIPRQYNEYVGKHIERVPVYKHACMYTGIHYKDTHLKTVPAYIQKGTAPVYKLSLPVHIWACIDRLYVVPLYTQVMRDCPNVYSHCLLI